jgi:citrate lyase subunit beta/citryl-CoA lyase
LQIGEADLRADLGASGEGANTALQYARNVVLYASSAAGIHPPVAAVSPDFKDLARFSETTRLFKEWGYFGRACIHPGQVEIVNEIFTPSEQEIERAMDILKRLDEAGGGVAVDAQGRMIDEAIARSARRLLDTSKKIANK